MRMTLRSMFCNMKKMFDRLELLVGGEGISRLHKANILVFGVGGVGSNLVNMLVRSGIENLSLVDFDTIDVTNINRQAVANSANVGKIKVEEMASQLKVINPNVNIKTYPIKLSEDTISQINFDGIDYIVDCIDDISAKKLLIKYATEHNIPLLAAMGAGNRYKGVPNFQIADISKTSYDPIAKILRKFCKDERIKKYIVCYTTEKAEQINCKTIGSVVYYVVNMASVMCAKIINDIIGG